MVVDKDTFKNVLQVKIIRYVVMLLCCWWWYMVVVMVVVVVVMVVVVMIDGSRQRVLQKGAPSPEAWSRLLLLLLPPR